MRPSARASTLPSRLPPITGRPAGGRLEEDDAEALTGARHGEHVCEREVVGQLRVGDLAGEHDAIGDAGALGQLSRRASIVAGADDEIGGVRDARENGGHGGDDAVVSLVALRSRRGGRR